jgi:hypothetical protein
LRIKNNQETTNAADNVDVIKSTAAALEAYFSGGGDISAVADAHEATAEAAQNQAHENAKTGANDQNGGDEGGESGQDSGAADSQSGAKDEAAQTDTAQTASTIDETRLAEMLEKLAAESETKAKEAALQALKLAAMPEAEREKHELTEREKTVAEREAAIIRRELIADAATMLTGKGLNTAFSEFVLAESKGHTQKRVDTLKNIFDEAVKQEVLKAIAGKTPPAGDKPVKTDMLASVRKLLGQV